MTDRQINAMVSDIAKQLDYDIWKDIFSRRPEDPETAKVVQAELRDIARRHIEKAARTVDAPRAKTRARGRSCSRP